MKKLIVIYFFILMISGCGTKESQSAFETENENIDVLTPIRNEPKETETQVVLDHQKILSNYLQESLIPQFGLAPLNRVEFFYGKDQEIDFENHLEGIIGASIIDLNNDQKEELIVSRITLAKNREEQEVYFLVLDIYTVDHQEVMILDSVRVTEIENNYPIEYIAINQFTDVDYQLSIRTKGEEQYLYISYMRSLDNYVDYQVVYQLRDNQLILKDCIGLVEYEDNRCELISSRALDRSTTGKDQENEQLKQTFIKQMEEFKKKYNGMVITPLTALKQIYYSETGIISVDLKDYTSLDKR